MKDKFKIFCINPGSTTTKIALFENDKLIFSKSVSHDAEILKEFVEINDQFPYRKKMILDILNDEKISLEDVDAFVGRGGALVALEGGTYHINEILLNHARTGYTIKHPAMLGSQLAFDFASTYKKESFVVDPPDVDEFEPVARVTGFKNIMRESRGHPLNQKEVARRHANSLGRKYEEMNFVVAHMGGGISVSAHKKGRIIDSSDATQGDGPLAPTRSGAIPATPLIKQCFSGDYTEKEMLDKIIKTGGMVDHLGTSDAYEVYKKSCNGDIHAKLIFDVMIYQIVKTIGSYAAVLKGEVDGILLTGGMAQNEYLTSEIEKSVSFISNVFVYAGEFEMEALAAGALRVLKGEEKSKDYSGIPVWQK